MLPLLTALARALGPVLVRHAAKNIFTTAKTGARLIQNAGKLASALKKVGTGRKAVDAFVSSFDNISEYYSKHVLDKLNLIKSANKMAGNNIATAMGDKFTNAIMDALIQGTKKKLPKGKLAGFIERYVKNQMKDSLDDLDVKLEAVRSDKISEIINNIKRGDEMADAIEQYSPFNKKVTREIAKGLEGKNWSLIGSVMMNVSFVFEYFKKNGFPVRKDMVRAIMAEILGVNPRTGKRITQLVNGKRIKSESIFDELLEFAKTHDKHETRVYTAQALIEHTALRLQEMVGGRQVKTFTRRYLRKMAQLNFDWKE